MNWMRRQLPPMEPATRLGERRLADAGDVLDEEVALGEEADEGEAHDFALALDDLLDVGDEIGEESFERRAGPGGLYGVDHDALQGSTVPMSVRVVVCACPATSDGSAPAREVRQ